jgi:hypothetical protein
MSERKMEKRELGEFDHIAMRGIGKLFISQGKQQELTLEGDDVAVSRIITNVKDGKLVIDVGRDWVEKLSAGFDFLSEHDIRITIVVRNLKELEVTGAADIEVKSIKTDDLTLRLIGASNIKVEALKADSLKAELPGAGKIRVDGEVKDLSVIMAGAGNFSDWRIRCNYCRRWQRGIFWITDYQAERHHVGKNYQFGRAKINWFCILTCLYRRV